MNLLANHFAFRLRVSDMQESIEFYESLGFKNLITENRRVFMQSKDLVIELSIDAGEHFSLVFFMQEDPEDRLYELGFKPAYSCDAAGRSEITVYSSEALALVFYSESFPGKGQFSGLCGNFSELSLRVADFKASVNFWAALGLRPLAGHPRSYPWAEMALEDLSIGLHQKADMRSQCRLSFESTAVELRKLPAGSYFKDPSAGTAFLEDPDGHEIWITYKRSL